MPVTSEALRTQFAYSAWATHRIVEAASKLTAEELTRDFHTADHSVLGTLVHVFAADRVWLGRIEGAPPAVFIDPDKDLYLPVLQNDWPALLSRWSQYLASATDPEGTISYKDLKGNPYENPLWQIVLHVVNHATHHRGQAAGFMRSMGHTPPALDMIRYYREL